MRIITPEEQEKLNRRIEEMVRRNNPDFLAAQVEKVRALLDVALDDAIANGDRTIKLFQLPEWCTSLATVLLRTWGLPRALRLEIQALIREIHTAGWRPRFSFEQVQDACWIEIWATRADNA